MQPLATGITEQEQKDVIVFICGYSETVTHTQPLVLVTTVFKRKGKVTELIKPDSDAENGKIVQKLEI